MLNLSLIRHAKSDWNHGIHDDMSRPISLKGINRTKKFVSYSKKKKWFLMKYSALHQKGPKKH